MKKRFNDKKDYLKLFILVLVIAIGYAYLSRQLTINTNLSINESVWDVYWDNLELSPNSMQPTNIELVDNTEVNFSADFNGPGDVLEFTLEAINDGNIDAMVNVISNITLTSQQQRFIDYSVTYLSGEAINRYDLIRAYDKKIYKIRLEYKTDIEISDLPSSTETVDIDFSIEYKKADENQIDSTTYAIISYYANGNISNITNDGEDIVRIERSNNPPASTITPINIEEYDEWGDEEYNSEYEILCWLDDTDGTLYFYTPADKIILDSNHNLFKNRENLEYIDMKMFEDSSELDLMFANDTKLNHLDLRLYDLTKRSLMYGAFLNCTSLTDLKLPEYKLKIPEYNSWVEGMFCNCPAYNNINTDIFPTAIQNSLTDCTNMTQYMGG